MTVSLSPEGVERTERAIPWRCFHCDEVLTTREAALEHFGGSSVSPSWCTARENADLAALRRRVSQAEARNLLLYRVVSELARALPQATVAAAYAEAREHPVTSALPQEGA